MDKKIELPKLTIREIAEEAGVSTQTVSRVINDRPYVADKTRKRVQSIIDRTGYYPSPYARGLTRTKNKIIGVLTSNIAEYGPSQSLAEIDREAKRHGYSLVLTLIHDQSGLKEAIRKMNAQEVAGLIWAVNGIADADFNAVAPELQRLQCPVLLNTADRHPAFPSVEIDNQYGAELAVEHLLDNGYRHIGIIAGPTMETVSQQRLQGWKNALCKNEIKPKEEYIFWGNWHPDSGYSGTLQLLNDYPEIDAIFCSNDQIAIGALRAIKTAGRPVPQAFGIIGFDDIPTAEYLSPSLSTIRQDINLGSQRAVQTLIEQIKRQEKKAYNEEISALETILITPELIERESTRRK